MKCTCGHARRSHRGGAACRYCDCQTYREPGAPALPEPGEDATWIGGHRDASSSYEALSVYRTPRGILKLARDAHNAAALANEARWLSSLEGAGIAPSIIDAGQGWVLEQDLGDSDPAPTNGEAFRRHMIQVIWTLRDRGVRHGDLTSANIVLRDNRPWLIDWQEAHAFDEPAPRKRPVSDSYLGFRTVADWPVAATAQDPLERGKADTPRIARRWLAVLDDLGCIRATGRPPVWGRSFLDLGCFQGDFVAMAAAEGMRAWGIDQGGFRSGENSIEIARDLWGSMGDAVTTAGGVHFDQADIMDLHAFTFDVVLLFSTWSYMVRDYGEAAARAKLAEIIEDCGVLYFENQLAGDGPGPAFFQSDDDVGHYLARLAGPSGQVRKLVTIPVTGRQAARSVFAVEARGG